MWETLSSDQNFLRSLQMAMVREGPSAAAAANCTVLLDLADAVASGHPQPHSANDVYLTTPYVKLLLLAWLAQRAAQHS
jgi:hypothetical protein